MKTKPKSKIETMRETLALAKADRKIPAVGVAARLAIHEVRIEKHLTNIDSSFFEIGKELAEIQVEKDFAEDTVESYVKNRFNRSRSWAYQMIEGYQTKAALPENVQSIVQNQAQALAIGKAPKKERSAILKEAVKQGDTSPKKIFSLIEVGKDKIERENEKPKEASFRVIVKDANGDEVPEEIAEEFQSAESDAKEQISHAQQIKNYLEQDSRNTVEARGLRETAKDLLAGLKTHLTKHVLCPKCNGKKCAVCSRRGFVSNHFATKGIGKK